MLHGSRRNCDEDAGESERRRPLPTAEPLRLALTRLPDQLVVVGGRSVDGARNRPRLRGAERQPHAEFVSGVSVADLSQRTATFTR